MLQQDKAVSSRHHMSIQTINQHVNLAFSITINVEIIFLPQWRSLIEKSKCHKPTGYIFVSGFDRCCRHPQDTGQYSPKFDYTCNIDALIDHLLLKIQYHPIRVKCCSTRAE